MPAVKLDKRVFDIRVELADVVPSVWRLVAVSAEATLPELHLTIQGIIGWENMHLHAFEIAGKRFEKRQGSRTKLRRLLREGMTFRYVYDFGDNWVHQVEVVRSYEVSTRRHHPKVLDGAGDGPPEDVGGPPGYTEFLRVVSGPSSPQRDDLLAWAFPFGRRRFDPQSATWRAHGMLHGA
jgi:hypothetical protein